MYLSHMTFLSRPPFSSLPSMLSQWETPPGRMTPQLSMASITMTQKAHSRASVPRRARPATVTKSWQVTQHLTRLPRGPVPAGPAGTPAISRTRQGALSWASRRLWILLLVRAQAGRGFDPLVGAHMRGSHRCFSLPSLLPKINGTVSGGEESRRWGLHKHVSMMRHSGCEHVYACECVCVSIHV